MLIEFTAKNWKSIKETQSLNLIKGNGNELEASNSFQTVTTPSLSLLRSTAIYGPNASGKSNFLKALLMMRDLVIHSAKEQRGDRIPVISFRLDESNENAPTEFEVTFITQKVRYQYGFSANSERILEEWLFAYPNGRAQKWLSRSWIENSEEFKDGFYQWEKCSALSGQKQLWQESTRQNALFLSTAVQLNSQQLQPAYDWFKNNLRIANISGWEPSFTAKLCQDNILKSKVMEFLKAADFDIHDVLVETEKMSAKHLPVVMPDELKSKVLKDIGGVGVFDVKTIHLSITGKQVSFKFDEESDGTQKFFSLAGPWIDALKNGYVLVIDELHDTLHPKMVEFLVKVFHNTQSNPKNAQLVFTTHETSILSQEIFRRDQLWFCEKDKNQATKLYPLTDFSPKKGRENLKENYLSGRYGALPYINKLKHLNLW